MTIQTPTLYGTSTTHIFIVSQHISQSSYTQFCTAKADASGTSHRLHEFRVQPPYRQYNKECPFFDYCHSWHANALQLLTLLHSQDTPL